MKTKKLQLMAVLAALLVTLNLQAQVTIGSLDAPKAGAILDLNSGVTGGLLFSNVAITTLRAIPNGFPGNPTGEANLTALKGMVVYNTNNAPDINDGAIQITPGLYTWTGTAWLKLTDDDALAILKGAISNIENVLLSAKASTTYVDELVGSKEGLNTIDKNTVVEGINSLKAEVGSAASLSDIGDSETVVDAIIWLDDHVTNLLKSSELEGSPFQSYAAFTAFLATYQSSHDNAIGKYAYVTFVGEDVIPPAWTRVGVGHSWRLDCGSGFTFGPTADMTNAITAMLGEGTVTPTLPLTGQSDVSTILQTYRNNLRYVYEQLTAKQEAINTKQDKLNGGTGIVKSAVGEISYLPDPLPIDNGGTGATTVAAARSALGLGNADGALPIANGGTGQTTAALARNALGLGNTTGALPVANGGTGQSSTSITKNSVFVSPSDGSGAPTFRGLVAADIPTSLGATTFTGAITVPEKTTVATNSGTKVATEAQVYKMGQRVVAITSEEVSIPAGGNATQIALYYGGFSAAPTAVATINTGSVTTNNIRVWVQFTDAGQTNFFVYNSGSSPVTIRLNAVFVGPSN